jgi:hypothetical protein
MDPQHNVAAVAARDSVASTLAATVERLAGDLNAQRLTARPLTGDDLAEVDTTVAAGLQPTSTRPGWRHLKHPDGYATSFWVSPRYITSETLDWLWLHNTDATVVTIRLTAAAGRPEVSAWVRYHSGEPLGKGAWAGLNRLTGRQLAAVQASLPAPATRPPLVVPARGLRDNEQLTVRVGPTLVGAAPQDSMSPAKGTDDARRAAAVDARDSDVPAVDRRSETRRGRETRCSDAGVAGLLTERNGPKRKSKLTPDTVAAIRLLRAGAASYRTVAATVGASLGSVDNALRLIHTGADADSGRALRPNRFR